MPQFELDIFTQFYRSKTIFLCRYERNWRDWTRCKKSKDKETFIFVIRYIMFSVFSYGFKQKDRENKSVLL